MKLNVNVKSEQKLIILTSDKYKTMPVVNYDTTSKRIYEYWHRHSSKHIQMQLVSNLF